MKFRKKPVVIEANVFEWGMEAGVMRYNEYILKDANDYPEEMRSTSFPGYLKKYEYALEQRGFNDGEWKPYVETIHNGRRVIIERGDYIIPEPDGIHFYPCKPDIFEKTYEAADESTEAVKEVEEALEEIILLPGEWNDAKQIARKALADLRYPEMGNNTIRPTSSTSGKEWVSLAERLVRLKPLHINPYNLGDRGEVGKLIDKLATLLPNK